MNEMSLASSRHTQYSCCHPSVNDVDAAHVLVSYSWFEVPNSIDIKAGRQAFTVSRTNGYTPASADTQSIGTIR